MQTSCLDTVFECSIITNYRVYYYNCHIRMCFADVCSHGEGLYLNYTVTTITFQFSSHNYDTLICLATGCNTYTQRFIVVIH